MNAQSHSPKYLLLTSHILGVRCERPKGLSPFGISVHPVLFLINIPCQSSIKDAFFQ